MTDVEARGPASTTDEPATKPSGPVAAVFVAAGVATLALGMGIVLNELDPSMPKLLDWSARFGIGSGVGPLSGKVLAAVIAFLAAWAILHFRWRDRELPFDRVLASSLVLVGLGFLLTFPPIFEGIAHLFGA